MNQAVAVDMMRRCFWLVLEVGGPILGVSLVVGVVVSLLAAVTQIQESSLVFLPKIAAMGVVLAILGPWMLKLMVAFTTDLFRQAVTLAVPLK